MKMIDFGLSDFIRPGIPSLQGLLLGLCFEKHVKAVDLNETH
jgi:hypothetical protein